MLIATYNANSIRMRLPTVCAWLKIHQPHILCIQETKVEDKDFPREEIERQGYQVVFKGQKSYNGVAVLAREDIDDVAYGFDDDDPSDETRLIRCTIGGLHIVNTYIPQGREIEHEMFAYKLEWFARLRRFFERHYHPDNPVIWTGDMNVAYEAIDVYNPEQQTNDVCYHERVREAFAQCRAWGFTDIFRKHRPEPGHYTYYDYRTPQALNRGRGWRIDYILATRPLAEKCCDAYIDMEPRRAAKPSDHTFLAAKIER